MLGGIALRHELDDYVLQFGQIGYGAAVGAPRRLATRALGQMLGEARGLGLDRVLIVCAVDNVASANTIAHHGGIAEEGRDAELGLARRDWIKL